MKTVQVPKGLIWLTLILFAVLITFTVVKALRSPDGPEGSSIDPVIDTVYMTRFVPVKSYKSPFQPHRYIFFSEVDTVEVEKVIHTRDTVKVYIKDSTAIDYNVQFLSQYPNASKLVQLLLDSENLSLTLFNAQGTLSTEEYRLDLDKFKYNYQCDEGFSYKKNNFFKRLHPFAEVQLRPINLMLDVNLGIYHKTGKIIYETGLNGFYYPRVKTYPGWDFYFKMRYNF